MSPDAGGSLLCLRNREKASGKEGGEVGEAVVKKARRAALTTGSVGSVRG